MTRPSLYLITCVVMAGLTACKQEQKVEFISYSKVEGMAHIPAGVLSMGGDGKDADRNEFPKHSVEISAFLMDETEVTNLQFSEFVEATSYKTIAERAVDWDEMQKQLPPNTPKPPDSLLAPGSLVFSSTERAVSFNDPSQWWQWVTGANWQHPTGPQSTIKELMDHPVVYIAYEDAVAYCTWAGKRLPTEAEWEWAARGGKENLIYPWGNENPDTDRVKANLYQGLFPYHNSVKDGFELTAPVKSFEANAYGLYDMAGNVWEWCSDWFDSAYYSRASASQPDTKGPSKAFVPSRLYQEERVIRGGSFLCNDSYCSGYRNARRMGSTSDSGFNHTGFRCVKDIK